MSKALIKLSYKHIIGINSKQQFEKEVFNDSYNELLMQAQAYNKEGKFTGFQEIVAANPKANSLHYKTGFAVGLYIRALNSIPGLYDTQNHISIPFATHRFEIIDSHLTDRIQHKVAIIFVTPELTLHRVIGNNLLLSFEEIKNTDEPSETFFLPLTPVLSISSYREVPAYHFYEKNNSL